MPQIRLDKEVLRAEEELTPQMKLIREFSQKVFLALDSPCVPTVIFVKDYQELRRNPHRWVKPRKIPAAAFLYDYRTLGFVEECLGKRFMEKPDLNELLQILFHELGHQRQQLHTKKFYAMILAIGAKFALYCVDHPGLVRKFREDLKKLEA